MTAVLTTSRQWTKRRIEEASNSTEFRVMLSHPPTEQISLPNVLAVLGDTTRLAILGHLARNEGEAQTCSRFADITSKTNLTYHLAKMREAGIINVEPCGTARLVSLRRADLDARFPGLLEPIIRTAMELPPPAARAE